MSRKVIVYLTVISFFFALNISAASMERKNSKSKRSVSRNYQKDSNSSSKSKAIQQGFDPMSTEMTIFESMMYDGGVAWADSVTTGQKITDVLSVIGWGAAWVTVFTVASGGLFPIVMALVGLAFMSFQGPWALNNMLDTDDTDGNQ